MKELSRTPIRKGNVYCSPACGMGCTHKAYEEANKKANNLCKKCEKEVGGKWISRIWENLGWHYSISLKNGDITIYPSYIKGEYSVHSNQGGTPATVFVNKNCNSLKILIKAQLEEVKKEADKWNQYLERNNKALGEI